MSLIICRCIVLKHAGSSEPAADKQDSEEEARIKNQSIEMLKLGKVTAKDIIERMGMHEPRVECLLEQLLYITNCLIVNTLIKHCPLSHRFHQFLNLGSSEPFFLLQRYVICVLPDFKSHFFEGSLPHMPLKVCLVHIQRLK